MKRRDFLNLAVASPAVLRSALSDFVGKPFYGRPLVEQHVPRQLLTNAMRTTELEAACLPTMYWPTVTISRAQVEKRWPSTPEVL